MAQVSETIRREVQKSDVELSDVHCHLDLFEDPYLTAKNSISNGVGLIITAGGSMESNTKASWISDELDRVFAVVGIDPSFVNDEYENIAKIEGICKSINNTAGVCSLPAIQKIESQILG